LNEDGPPSLRLRFPLFFEGAFLVTTLSLLFILESPIRGNRFFPYALPPNDAIRGLFGNFEAGIFLEVGSLRLPKKPFSPSLWRGFFPFLASFLPPVMEPPALLFFFLSFMGFNVSYSLDDFSSLALSLAPLVRDFSSWRDTIWRLSFMNPSEHYLTIA